MNRDPQDLAAAVRRLPRRVPPGLDARWRQAAEASGAVEVAYQSFETPVGRLLAARTRAGLVRLAYVDAGVEPILAELAGQLSPNLMEIPTQLAEVRRQLDAYARGRRQRFDLPCDWQLIRGFAARVLGSTAAIAYGQVRTYAAVAAAAGAGGAARAAGNALAGNPIAIVIPCHRVVRTGGGLGGYAGGLDRKRFLLDLEGAGRRRGDPVARDPHRD